MDKESQKQESIEDLLLRASKSFEPIKADIKLKIFYALKFLTTFYIISFLIYQKRKKERTEYYTVQSPKTKEYALQMVDGYIGCETLKSESYLRINGYTAEYQLFFYLTFKFILLLKQIRDFYYIQQRGCITKTQMFGIRFFDFVNIFFDYSFAISLSPLTAFVLNKDCLSFNFGINFFYDPLTVYIYSLIIGTIGGIVFLVLGIFTSDFYGAILVRHTHLLLGMLPLGMYILYIKVKHDILSVYNVYTVTYYSGEVKVSDDREDRRCYVKTIAVGLVIQFILIAYALLHAIPYMFYFCHYLAIGYYVLNLILSVVSFFINKNGLDFYYYHMSLFTVASFYDTIEFQQIFGQQCQQSIQKIQKQDPILVEAKKDCNNFIQDKDSLFQIKTILLLVKIFKLEFLLDASMSEYQKIAMD